jgi:hypothetical protein
MSKWDRYQPFTALVTDRTPGVPYGVSQWLSAEAPPAFTGDWIIADFTSEPVGFFGGVRDAPKRSAPQGDVITVPIRFGKAPSWWFLP